MFDINDFDDTLPGPWEWDVKRMAVGLLWIAAGVAALFGTYFLIPLGPVGTDQISRG